MICWRKRKRIKERKRRGIKVGFLRKRKKKTKKNGKDQI
jgi:hypothetical protein